jgi:hypothetical protein
MASCHVKFSAESRNRTIENLSAHIWAKKQIYIKGFAFISQYFSV